ncbi:DgyrCDS14671 [Dimorphilus gyrociliatus]|uniref:DgyrCDS14671 n=1 Tax=Dimorphilus gyrociliatus TaxID=2664684 RepID=A0A7I8WEU9_9ANNE|nr:DgyrCDS14671 [Dimorphilus gyrociliatus]
MVWSQDIRDLVIKKYSEIGKLRATARVLGMAPSSIRYILKYKKPEQENRGGPKKLSDREIVRMKRILKKFKDNKQRRELKRQNFKYKRVRQRTDLTSKDCKHRKAYCLKVISENLDWSRVIFTDEARFSLSGPNNFRTWTSNSEKDFRVTKNMGRGGVLVWGLIISDGIFEVWRIRSKLNAENYSSFIVEDVLPVIEEIEAKMGRQYIFQQDNAGCHTARKTKRAFKSNNIKPIDWPARSPDLSPIENMWHLTKTMVYDSPQFETEDELWEKIMKCSYEVINRNPLLLPGLYGGMGSRISKCIEREVCCKFDKDCLYPNGKCINGVCQCDYSYYKEICSLGVDYVSTTFDCFGDDIQYEDMDDMGCGSLTIGLQFPTKQSRCHMKTKCNYQIYKGNYFDELLTMIPVDLFENELCHNDSFKEMTVEHCLTILWRKYSNCSSGRFWYDKNFNKWYEKYLNGVSSTDEIKNDIEEYGNVNKNFEILNISNSSKEILRNNYCHGIQSSGKYNIAYRKEIKHNSEISNPEEIYHINHIVDGIKNSNEQLGGCSKLFKMNAIDINSLSIWLFIDLITDYTIRDIDIYLPNRRLEIGILEISVQKFKNILFTNNSCITNIFLNTTKEINRFTCQNSMIPGQYVNISFIDTEPEVVICEIEIYTNNLALHADVFVLSVKDAKSYGEPVIGQFVLLKANSSTQTVMKLKRIEIVGLYIDKPEFINIARGKPCWQSSNYPNTNHPEYPFYAAFATDGSSRGHCSITKVEIFKWFYVDLLNLYRIFHIGLKMRHSNNGM